MRRIKCFMIEPTGKTRYWHRRYRSSALDKCGSGYHDGMALVGDLLSEPAKQPRDAACWPKKCDRCDFTFGERDAWQLFGLRLWHDPLDSGKGVFTIRDCPSGAMWYVDWFTGPAGPDGKILAVQTPGGEWLVDYRASNCTLPKDDVHRCWVRHGTPPNVTVDKNGVTCAAGAGSIACGGYHGFLRNGYLED